MHARMSDQPDVSDSYLHPLPLAALGHDESNSQDQRCPHDWAGCPFMQVRRAS